MTDFQFRANTSRPVVSGRRGTRCGGAAALASGLTPLEIGSDIGGSIRVPAAFCGVYGHRPSGTAVPRTGAFPMDVLPNPATVMAVQGPLARSAADLEVLFDVVRGPDQGEDAAWALELPAARHEQLAGFRVAIMPPLSWVSPSAEMQAKVDELRRFLENRGARVGEAMPSFDRDEYFRDYLRLLMFETSLGQPREAREESASRVTSDHPIFGAQADGFLLDAPQHFFLLNRREVARAAWRAFFEEWDVIVSPMTLDAAFRHQVGDQAARVLSIDGNEVAYMMNIVYPMWAIFAGLPSTAFPGGLNSAGLPLGLQAIGPYLEDRTTLRFAQLLEREWQGFQPPPGY